MNVLELLDKNEADLRSRHHVKKIGVFGSVARNEAAATSDVDILVEFEQPVDFFEFIDLKEYLEKLLGRRVDLVTVKALKPQLKEHILKEVVYA
ncbi:MAG: nucleotidyltransferase family protein [Nitrospirota bacterium]